MASPYRHVSGSQHSRQVRSQEYAIRALCGKHWLVRDGRVVSKHRTHAAAWRMQLKLERDC